MSENLPAERKVSYASVDMQKSGGGGMLMPETLGDVVAFAQVMSRADVALPKHLRGNDGACLAVAMQALRWQMDPFAVANKSYLVNDRLAYEAQLVASVVHVRAPIKGRPDYSYSGTGPTRQCTVTCVMADGEPREYTSPRFEQITTKNSPLWKSDPDQQLGYFAIRSWARRHTPEVILGVYTPDEVETFRDVTPKPSGVGESLRQHRIDQTSGFNRAGIDSAIDGEPEFVEPVTVADLVAEAVSEDPTLTPEEALEMIEPVISEPTLADMTPDQRKGWAEAFRATVMKNAKSTQAMMAEWNGAFDTHLGPLQIADPELFASVETWFGGRLKRFREQEAAQS